MRKESRVESRESSGLAPSSRAKRGNPSFFLLDSRLSILITLCFLFTACGFQPLHGQNNQSIDLSSIVVKVDQSRGGQLLEAEIADALNPTFQQHEKLYVLTININQTEQRLFINPDGSSSRSDIPVASNYSLTRITDGKLLDSGAITRISTYNTSITADYSSYVSLQDAKKRAIKELAQSYKLRLANTMAKINNKNDNIR